jgi:PEP-CTERM motif
MKNLLIGLLVTVAMPITANAATTILTFEQIPGTSITVDNDPDLTAYFAPVYITDFGGVPATVEGAYAEFELQITPEATGYDYSLAIPSETGIGGNYNDFTYFQAQWLEPVLLTGPDLSATFTWSSSNVGIISGFLGDGNRIEGMFELGPIVGGSVVAVGTPEPSTWAMMLMGFVGLAFAGYRKARKPISIIASV